MTTRFSSKINAFAAFCATAVCLICVPASAQNIQNNPRSNHGNKFEQLGTILPDANTYRTASGAPGHQYWQQRADYDIEAVLNEQELRLDGNELITYYNNSPDALSYLWLQLDENQHHPEGENNYFDATGVDYPLTTGQLDVLVPRERLKGLGVNIISVTDEKGNPLPYTINYTMMRIDLPAPLQPGASVAFRIKWNYKLPERLKVGGRGGFERFDDGNCVFTITQWFPRLCVYSDYQGWNNKQFTGRGEFALPFGNYKVKMTVPSDHVIAATGTCTNIGSVLNQTEMTRWKQAENSDKPVFIVTHDEALNKEKKPVTTGTKTWEFTAENVRDFAWGSSRKFVWDAMGITVEGKKTMCMSFYPDEAFALYSRYSTKVVAHTIRTYSKFTIPYPYPVAISVEAANGMEYPMIAFNYGRTEPDGTYSERTKYGMITVIIHEVGHNFFPMIVNSDERQWSWMDEGLNTFVQFLTEQEFDNNFPSARGPAHKIVDYMKMPPNQLEPIMTNSENIIQFGPNAYSKPATALNILRETVMGRELFDFAFKQYCKRWAFHHPTPADFFRTMEDASGVDLDWYWRGWFYDIEAVDISLDSVRAWSIDEAKTIPVVMDTLLMKGPQRDSFEHVSKLRNRESGMKFLVDIDTTLRDFYYYYDPEKDDFKDIRIENRYNDIDLPTADDYKKYKGNYVYELSLSNKGGLVMPVIVQWTYRDGTTEVDRISAYIWRKNEKRVVKTFMKPKEVVSVTIDPYKETADIDTRNNNWPQMKVMSRFELFKSKVRARGSDNGNNPMKRNLKVKSKK